ncbi:HAD-IIA family hydrolase [bacterium]|nr:MAG: HAD-IIA family hydrolase [bacterium]
MLIVSSDLVSFDLTAVKALIFDLDGVIWRGQSPIPGASDSVARLRAAGHHCLFATNNSTRLPEFFSDKLGTMGIKTGPETIVTSSTATATYLSRQFPSGFSAYVVGEEGIANVLRNIGARVVDETEAIEKVDCVVVGIDRGFNYAKLQRAQQFLLRGARFIATNRDATFPIEGGVTPGAGSIVASVATAAGMEPLSMGKPEPAMLLTILEEHGLEKHQAAMIGDRLDTDIACAHRAGIGALFVATGVTPMHTAQEASGELRPHLFYEDLPALCAALDI